MNLGSNRRSSNELLPGGVGRLVVLIRMVSRSMSGILRKLIYVKNNASLHVVEIEIEPSLILTWFIY